MIIAAALLTACGGGSSGNPSRPPFQLSLVHSGVAFAGDTYEIRVSSGQAPYSFQSSNEYVISDTNIDTQSDDRIYIAIPNTVSAETQVSLIITDKNGTSGQALITVRPSYLYPGNIWVTPFPGAPEECSFEGTSVGVETEGYASICAGTQGTVQVVLNASGVAVSGQQIRFEWVQGDYFFPESTAFDQKTITTITDGSGKATATIKAREGAKTHIAYIRAVVVSNNEQSVLHPFMIATRELSVYPDNFTWTDTNCTTTTTIVSVFGGTPPYRFVFPTSQFSASPNPITESGGSTVITVRGCTTSSGIDVLIYDANGVEATINITVEEKEEEPVTEPETPALSAISAWNGGNISCGIGDSYSFIATGGTSPLRFVLSGPAVAMTPALYSYTTFSGTGTFTFNANATAGDSYTVTVFDSSSPMEEKRLTFTCN
jgi:hypothetical protein